MIQWSILIGIYYRTGDYRLYLYAFASYDHFPIGCCSFFFSAPSIMHVARSMWNCTLYVCSNTWICFSFIFYFSFFFVAAAAILSDCGTGHTGILMMAETAGWMLRESSLAVQIEQCMHGVQCAVRTESIKCKRPVWNRNISIRSNRENKETDKLSDATLTYY